MKLIKALYIRSGPGTGNYSWFSWRPFEMQIKPVLIRNVVDLLKLATLRESGNMHFIKPQF